MKTRYFTVFDKNYAARGLLMLESLCRVSPARPDITVLALDEDTARAVQGLATVVLRPGDLKDAEFLAARDNRSYPEFCWTAASVLSAFMVSRAEAGDLAIYLDADLYFFSDPATVLAEMGSDKNILIHPHRFSADMAEWEKAAGVLNVGLVGFRASE